MLVETHLLCCPLIPTAFHQPSFGILNHWVRVPESLSSGVSNLRIFKDCFVTLFIKERLVFTCIAALKIWRVFFTEIEKNGCFCYFSCRPLPKPTCAESISSQWCRHWECRGCPQPSQHFQIRPRDSQNIGYKFSVFQFPCFFLPLTM